MLNVFFTVASVHHTVKFMLLSESCVHLILMVRMPIFFFFTRCSCPTKNYNYYCIFCVRLCFVLNNDVWKICVDVGSTDELPLELIYIDKYLYDSKAFPFFIFDHREQAVLVRLDHWDQGTFFISSETRNIWYRDKIVRL